MDCVDDNQHVSVWRGGIFAKVTRISLDNDTFVDDRSSISSNDVSSVYKNAEMPSQSVHSSVSTTPPVSRYGASAPVVTETLLDVFDAPSTSSNTATTGPSIAIDLFGGAPPAATNNGGAEGSLLDMEAPVYTSAVQNNYSSSSHEDFLGMTVATNSVNAPPKPTHNTVHPMPTQPQPSVTMAPPTLQSKLPPSRSGSTNAFNTFSQKSGPFGDLGWK